MRFGRRGKRYLVWAVAFFFLYIGSFVLSVHLFHAASDVTSDNPNNADLGPDDTPLLASRNAILPSTERDHLRGFSSQVYSQDDTYSRTLSGFLTRLYDAERVNTSAGCMGPRQLLAYYNQKSLSNSARVRFFGGVIDLDQQALSEMRSNDAVNEMLLLVFNDWDFSADNYIQVLQDLSTRMRVFQGVPEHDIPSSVMMNVAKEGVNLSYVASARRNAFASLLNANGETAEKRGLSRLFFLWPKPEKTSEPTQIVASIRPADFNGDDFLGRNTLAMTLQSPGIFFCSKGMQHVVAYSGPPTVRRVSDFIIANTVSLFQLRSASELKSVLQRFDKLALIVCKKSGYNAASFTSPLRDILFNDTLGLRFGLKAALPTFFVQEERFHEFETMKLDKLRVLSTERLEPDSLAFMATLYKDEFPENFVQQLHLFAVSDNAQLIVLDRMQLASAGQRGATLADFSARILLFPAPDKKTNPRMWSDSFGMRLVDFVESTKAAQPLLTHVTEKSLQRVYERHFRMSYTEMLARMRQNPFVANKGGNSATAASTDAMKRKTDLGLLVLLVLSGDNTGGSDACEGAAFHAAHAGNPSERIQYATVAVNEAPALVEELRFSVWRHVFKGRTAKLCEVYVFHANGKVRAMEIEPSNLRSPANGWLKLFRDDVHQTSQRKLGNQSLAISHPTQDEFRAALKEMRTQMQNVNSRDLFLTLRTSLYGTLNGFAPWFLWLPSLNIAPFLVHVQRQKGDLEKKPAEGATLVLVHDSSCGMTTNHLKAFRLLARCQQSKVLSLPIDLVEYDLANSYRVPAANGQWFRSVSAGRSGERYSALYGLLEPFLQNLTLLRPPKIFALNHTHAISTLSTARYFATGKGVPELKKGNGFVRTFAQLASYVDQRINVDAVLRCAENVLLVEKQERQRFRPSKVA